MKKMEQKSKDFINIRIGTHKQKSIQYLVRNQSKDQVFQWNKNMLLSKMKEPSFFGVGLPSGASSFTCGS